MPLHRRQAAWAYAAADDGVVRTPRQSGAARCGKQICNRGQDAAVEDVEGGQMRINYKNYVYEASKFRFTDNHNDIVCATEIVSIPAD